MSMVIESSRAGSVQITVGGRRAPEPSTLPAVVAARFREEGVEILERLGIRPGPELALPPEQRFRIDNATAQSWMLKARLLHRLATAIAVGALLAFGLQLAHLLAPATWTIWKVAGICACVVGLVARHAELQLRSQLQLEGAAPARQPR
jgi:hypothetical protein